jgi:hypothetical protein
MRFKSCEECCCVDSKDNPIIEEWDSDKLIKTICMMCYAESLNERQPTNN